MSGNGGNIFCTNCGFKLGPGDRFCPECGTPRPEPKPAPGFPPPPPPFQSSLSSAPAYSGLGGGLPLMSMAPAVAADNKPLLEYDVDYPDRSSRLLVLARVFLSGLILLPHYIVLLFLWLAVLIIWPISFFAILFLGRYPRGMWEFVLNTLRWSANVQAWYLGQRDNYPPFSGTEEYPVQYELAYPERLSRWLIFVKWLLLIPNVIVFLFVAVISYIAVLLGWIAVLFVGHFPKGLFDFITGSSRWANRITVYYMLLTDAYPPFRMSE